MIKRLFILILVFWSSAAFGATYYVSTSGSNGSSGTSTGSAWRTIQYACDRVHAGDTVYIRGGNYDETINLDWSTDGTQSSPIKFTRYQEEIVNVRGASAGNTYTWTVSGDWIILDGLYLKMNSCRLVGNGGDVLVQGNHVTVTNCNFIGNNAVYEHDTCDSKEMGVIINGADYTTVSYCYFDNMPFQGVKIKQASSNNAPLYFHVHHNTYVNGYSNGTMIEGQTGIMQYGLVEFNTFGGSYVSDSVQSNGFFENNVDPTNYGVWIRNNILYGNAENGVDRKGSRYFVIENNVVYGCKGDNDGPTQGGNDLIAGPGVSRGSGAGNAWDNIIRGNVVYDNHGGIGLYTRDYCYNNTILNNDRSYVGPNQSPGSSTSIYNGVDPSYNAAAYMFNNIMGYGALCDMREHVDGVNLNHTDYNLYISGNFTNCVYDNPTLYKYTSESSWKDRLATTSNQGKDSHSVFANPQFNNVSSTVSGSHTNWDFRIGSGSPARGAAGPVTLADGSGTDSTNLCVDDVNGFQAGIPYFGLPGDTIKVGGYTATITEMNRNTDCLTLDTPITWSNNASVFWCPNGVCPSSGNTDIGAIQYGQNLNVGTGGVYIPPDTDTDTGTETEPDTEPDTDPATILFIDPVDGDTWITPIPLTVRTDKNAEVRYYIADVGSAYTQDYNLMTPMDITGELIHRQTVDMTAFCNKTVVFLFKTASTSNNYTISVSTATCTDNLLSGSTLLATSNNFHEAAPYTQAYDGLTNTNFGNENQTNVWLEFDLGRIYNINSVNVFGNLGGSWYCDTFDIETKNNLGDVYSSVINGAACDFSGWMSPTWELQQARYLKYTFYAPESVEVREIYAAGFPGEEEPPDTIPRFLKFSQTKPNFYGSNWIIE